MSERSPKRRCMALTKAGDQCAGYAANGSDYCGPHGPRAGRKTKLTEATIQGLETAARNGAFNNEAAAAIGVDPRTLYRWMQTAAAHLEEGQSSIYTELSQRLTRATAEAELEMIQVIQNAARVVDWKAAAWYLERKHPARWSAKQTVTHEGNADLGRPKLIIPSSDEARLAIAQTLADAGINLTPTSKDPAP